MLLEDLRPTVERFTAATGWKIEGRGACHGDLCVPLGAGALDEDAGRVDGRAVAERLGMALVEGEEGAGWAIGPASFSGRTLAGVDVPDLELETFDGAPFRLSSLRGTRYVLVAWAPY